MKRRPGNPEAMRLGLWLSAALLMTALLAGCAKDDDGADPTTTTPATTTPTTTAPPPTDRGATLEADLLEGVAPLEVLFTLNATGTDATTSWSLAFGDDADDEAGFDLPATVNHTYEAGGNFTALATVTYGDGENVTANVTIRVEAPDVEPPAAMGYHAEYEDSAAFAVGAVCGQYDLLHNFVGTPANGTFYLEYGIPVLDGASLLSFTATAEAVQGLVPDYDAVLYDPSGAVADSSGAGATAEEMSVANPGPGTWVAVLCSFAAVSDPAMAPATVVIDVTY